MSNTVYQLAHADLAHLLCLLAVCALALYVLLASACRVYKLNPGAHKLGWRLMYVAFAAYPALLIGYVLTHQPGAELLTLLATGLAGHALNLAITHAQWAHNNVAGIARRDYRPHAVPPAFANAQFDHHHAAQANAAAEKRWQAYKKESAT